MAYVVGSGPNGLTAAILLARAGVRTTVLEAQPTIGGGTSSAELTLPGFVHDVCSAVHPLAVCSPVFREFPLADYGLEWIQPPQPAAHPLDDGRCGLARDLDLRVLEPLKAHWDDLVRDVLAPLHWPQHPLLFGRFGLLSAGPATFAARVLYRNPVARAVFAGMAAHSILPLEKPGSAAFGIVLGLAALTVGWPIPRGGSQRIANALAAYFESLGGRIVTGTEVRSLDELKHERPVLLDVSPRQLLRIAGSRLPDWYGRKLERYRYGPGVFKVDWALSAPIPWTAADCRLAGTVHLGGTLEEVAASERAPWEGQIAERPFVLLAQPSLFDSTRAPAGQHTAWAYCHVPNGSTENALERIEAQVERFAPGFRRLVLARHTMGPAEMERHNANLVGGDIAGGAGDLAQLFLRPTRSMYRTPLPGVYLCSASTPPGAGVHGMCGYHAARMALGASW